jgi:hypothetical protein
MDGARNVSEHKFTTLASCTELPWLKQTKAGSCFCFGEWGKYLRNGNNERRVRIDPATSIWSEAVMKDPCKVMAEKKNRIWRLRQEVKILDLVISLIEGELQWNKETVVPIHRSRRT